MSEFGLHMLGSLGVLMQQEYLDSASNYFSENEPCHIYMITRRPRIMLDPNSIKITEDVVEGRFLVQQSNRFESYEFASRNKLGTSDIQVESPYPHNEFRFRNNQNGEIITSGKSAILMGNLMGYQPILDVEVLYVGQSYGVDGARTAPQRLKGHSTLQAIYAEALKNTPDQEVWLILWAFEPILAMSFDGRAGQQFSTTDEEDNQHTQQVISQLINEQQQINFTEAALIRYFRPEYNQIYKETFPNLAHKTYSECYDIDLNSVSVELQTEELGFRLWSPSVESQWQHMMFFPLHSKEERIWMFDF